jgi:tRNA threonylcarbamoyladenosine biosynthesis protein TsaE
MESIMQTPSFTLISESANQTATFGTHFGRLLKPGDLLCLSGDLGAGKTAFTNGIGRGWGAREAVSSPTFVFSHEHRRAQDQTRLVHLDCYRLNSVDDAESIGIEDLLSGVYITVIEWPERILTLLPAERLWIEILIGVDDLDDNDAYSRRLFRFFPVGERAEALLSEFRKAL